MTSHLAIRADARRIPLADRSVHCVVTSPPYFDLRDYGVDGQIGSEVDPVAYVREIVNVFREVRRVLRDDGTLWLNLGDSYASRGYPELGIKTKDLIGVPWMVALALRADGWYLRGEVIWHKTNPMPGSFRDRPTPVHEQLFLLAKRSHYFYDRDAIREPLADPTIAKGLLDPLGKNAGSVWRIATKRYPGAHFATFPPKLVEPCINAGTSERGCCSSCGAPIRRLSETRYVNPGNRTTNGPRSVENRKITAGFRGRLEAVTTTTGWEPTCGCGAPAKPCVVLDPFGGVMTTAVVSEWLGRNSVSLDLSAEWLVEGRERLGKPRPTAKPKGKRLRPARAQRDLFDMFS